MKAVTLKVAGMRCAHCVDAITRALRESGGVRETSVDLEKGRAVVSGEDLDAEALARVVQELGYEAAPVEE